MKIDNKMLLRDKLIHADYEVIRIWNTGEWAEIGNSDHYYNHGAKPLVTIHRVLMSEMTHEKITKLFKMLETTG